MYTDVLWNISGNLEPQPNHQNHYQTYKLYPTGRSLIQQAFCLIRCVMNPKGSLPHVNDQKLYSEFDCLV